MELAPSYHPYTGPPCEANLLVAPRVEAQDPPALLRAYQKLFRELPDTRSSLLRILNQFRKMMDDLRPYLVLRNPTHA
jgi:hypothetical protein